MRLINRISLLLLFVLIVELVLISLAKAETLTNLSGSKQNVELSNLNGEKAIECLKRGNEYGRLAKAAKTARGKNAKASDTLLAQSVKLTASDGAAFDSFGGSVAISGNTAVVGAYGDDVVSADQGSAYVFARNGTGWTQQAKLIASDGASRDGFGISVAILDDTIIVGAHTASIGTVRPGAAYVFVRDGTTWTQRQKLVAGEGVQSDNFGASVAISGGTIVVGAQGHTIGANSRQGAVYVFARSGTVWAQQAKLIADDGAANNAFGASVAINGDTIIAGAQQNLNRGAAYIFVRNTTTWTQQTKLVAGDGASGDEFGAYVAISGDTVAVTAELDDVGANADQGSAYVFVRSDTIWTQQAKLTASDGEAQDIFGASVGISGETVIVGAIFDTVGVNFRQGSAYVFARSGTTWIERQKLVAGDGAEINTFGRGVAINGKTIIVGAPSSDIGANLDQGSAYIFANPQTLFDFDGDGKADVSIFRPTDRVWYMLRSGSGFTAAQFGLSSDRIVPADYDGDGRTDIAVFRDGTWYWLGSSNGSFNAVQFGQAGDIPAPGDYTGDGRAEIVVYRDGTWYTLNLANNQLNAVQFGISTDKPVPADYDGDGRTDIAVYRDGIWYLLRSSQSFIVVQLGNATDKPVVGDYDGDSKADQAVYRSGVWYVLGSARGFYAVQFGQAGDIPVAADYDGDGKTDIAVFRNGVWYLLESAAGFSAIQFGLGNDKPVPAAFVP